MTRLLKRDKDRAERACAAITRAIATLDALGVAKLTAPAASALDDIERGTRTLLDELRNNA